MALRLVSRFRTLTLTGVRTMSQAGDFGSGSGKGGGTGGSIRDAGGAFGKMEAAHEEQYFRKQQAEQIATMKEHMAEMMKKDIEENIKHHEEVIKANQEAIARQKRRMQQLDSGKDSDSD